MVFFVTQAISGTVARSSLEESCNGEAWNVHCNHHIWGINTIRLHWLKSLQRGQTRDIILAVHVQSMKNKSVNSEVILTMILQIIMQIGAVKIKEGKETSSCYPCNSQFPGSFATVVCLKPRTGCCFMLVARQPFPLKDELVTRRQFDMTFSHSARGIADVNGGGVILCLVLFGVWWRQGSQIWHIYWLFHVLLYFPYPPKRWHVTQAERAKTPGGLMTLLGPDAPSNLAWLLSQIWDLMISSFWDVIQKV